MPTLHEVQNAVAAAILGRAADAARYVASEGIAAERRLAVYRHHFRISLTDALTATFPVVQRLVGDGFFRRLASGYIDMHPPQQPCLGDYGAEFAPHIAADPACRDLAYLADVARLEWAMNAAYHAAEAEALPALALVEVPESRTDDIVLQLHPSARLLRSPYPILAIWQANQPGADPDTVVDLDAGGDDLVVYRRHLDVVWSRLAADEFAFVEALERGATLRQAHERGLFVDAEFAAGASLGRWLAADLFTGFTLPFSS